MTANTTARTSVPRPVPDRRLTALDLADGALAILRGRPRTVAIIAAAFVLPVQLLTAYLERGLFDLIDFGEFDSETGQFAGQSEFTTFGSFNSGSWIGTVLAFLMLPFLGVALTYLVARWRQGVDPSAGECLRYTLGKAHIIVAVFILGKLIQLFTLGLTTPMTMLLAPVVAAEGVGPLRAVSRAFELGRKRYGQLFGLLLLVFLVNVVLTYPLLALPLVAGFLLGDWGWIAYFALGSVGATVLNILAVGIAVLAYFEIRDRVEGADLDVQVRAAQPNPA